MRPQPPTTSGRRVDALPAVAVGLLLTFILVDGNPPAAQRVILVGQTISSVWKPACSCWLFGLRSYLGPVFEVQLDGPRAPQLDEHVLAVGRVDPVLRTLVKVDWLTVMASPVLTSRSTIGWLEAHPLVAAILLPLLLLHGWESIRAAHFITAAAGGAVAAAILLDLGALMFAVGVTDITWALAMTIGACAGAEVARHVDAASSGAIGRLVAGSVAALLFGETGGAIAALLGFSVPVLSRQATAPFLTGMCLCAALELPDTARQAVAAIAVMAACVHHRRLTRPSAAGAEGAKSTA